LHARPAAKYRKFGVWEKRKGWRGRGVLRKLWPMSRADLARMIADARNIVAFTGAGISTESGIPDFRSPGGVWSQMQPIYFQDFVASEEKRREAWTRVFSGRAGWVGAKPNAGHHAVARLGAQGKVSFVITQNVDNLHQDSGVPAERVIELHGNASYATCLECGLRHELEALRGPFAATGEPPACRACMGIVKTATISFGQAMPEGPMTRAEAATLACDLFLVLGSSLVVYPAAGFPVLAKRNGAQLVIVNREPTDLDAYADLVLHDEIGPAMSQAAAANSSGDAPGP
jgi:NAD-dependent deacetylase